MTTPLLILLALLQIADGYTTSRILAKGGKELNPVMAKLFEAIGVKPTLIGKGIFVMALGYYVGLHSVELLLFICAVYVLVVWNNIKQLKKQESQ